MSTRQRKHSKIKPLLVPAASLVALAYFAFHAVEGQYGLSALARLQEREAQLAVELAALKESREALDERVALLRPDSLDPDLIDERARQALNLADPRDIVIFMPDRR